MANLSRSLADNDALRQLGIVLLAVLVGVGGGVAVVAGNPVVPFALIAAAAPMPWLLTRPMAGVLLVVAIATLLPFGTMPFNVGVTPAFIELGLLLVVMVVGLQLISRRDVGAIRTPLDLWLFLFLGAISFAFVLGLSRDANSTILHNFFKLMLAITFFYTATQVLRSRDDIRLVVRAIVTLGGLSTLLGLALWAIPDAIAQRLLLALRVVGYPTDRVLRYVEDDPTKGQRATGTSVDPNSFGGLILLVFAFTLVQFSSKKPLLPRPLLLFFLGVEGVTLILTSRGAFLAAVVVVGFVGILRYRRLVVIGGIGGGAAVLVLGASSGYLARIVSGLRFEDQAQLMRLAEYSNALNIIGRYPAFGVGFGTAGELDLTTGVSSIYLTLAERSGLFGLITFLICMGAFFVLLLPWLLRREPGAGSREPGKAGANHANLNPQPATRNPQPDADVELDAVVLGAAGAVVGALVVGVGDHYFFNIEYPHMVALLWLALALGLAARRLLLIGQSEQEASKNAQ